MARVRSDKSKKTPLDKPVDKKQKMVNARSDEGVSTNAEPSGRGISETYAQPSLQSPTQPTKPNRSKKRPEQQPSVDVRGPEKVSEPTESTSILNGHEGPNGHEGSEHDSATHRRIAERAYMLFRESGYEHGNDWSHWFEAERQIKGTRV